MSETKVYRDFEHYAALHGAGAMGFGDAGLHRNTNSASDKVWRKKVEAQSAKDSASFERREVLRAEYARLKESGEIREMSAWERTKEAASGHDDNPAVQAARRIIARAALAKATGPATQPETLQGSARRAGE